MQTIIVLTGLILVVVFIVKQVKQSKSTLSPTSVLRKGGRGSDVAEGDVAEGDDLLGNNESVREIVSGAKDTTKELL